jgi:hypothetical protein
MMNIRSLGMVLATLLLAGACGPGEKSSTSNTATGGVGASHHEEWHEGGPPNGNDEEFCIAGVKLYDPTVGEADSAELTGVEGIRIEVYGEGVTEVTFTDEDGLFEICGLPAGEYLVVEVLPDDTDTHAWMSVGDGEAHVTLEGGIVEKFEGNQIGDEFGVGNGEILEVTFDIDDYPGLSRVEVKSATTIAGMDIDCPNGDSVVEGVDGPGTARIEIETDCETVTITSSKGISWIRLFYGEVEHVEFRNFCLIGPGKDILDFIFKKDDREWIRDHFDAIVATNVLTHPFIVAHLGEIETANELIEALDQVFTTDEEELAARIIVLVLNVLLGHLDEDDLIMVGDDEFITVGDLLADIVAADDFTGDALDELLELLRDLLGGALIVVSPEPCPVHYNDNGNNNFNND